MSELTQDAKGTLNTLIETCRDGQQGFQEAAKGVADPALRAELVQYSMQRREFASALQQAMQTMGAGAQSQDTGSMAAAIHRGWMKVREAITSHDDYSILSECERGEDAALDSYRDAMSHAVPPGIDDLVETQFSAVKQVHDRIRSLRDASKSVH